MCHIKSIIAISGGLALASMCLAATLINLAIGAAIVSADMRIQQEYEKLRDMSRKHLHEEQVNKMEHSPVKEEAGKYGPSQSSRKIEAKEQKDAAVQISLGDMLATLENVQAELAEVRAIGRDELDN